MLSTDFCNRTLGYRSPIPLFPTSSLPFFSILVLQSVTSAMTVRLVAKLVEFTFCVNLAAGVLGQVKRFSWNLLVSFCLRPLWDIFGLFPVIWG